VSVPASSSGCFPTCCGKAHEAIYEVELFEPPGAMHSTDMAYIHPDVAVDLRRFDPEFWASRYWNPIPAPDGSKDNPELLIGGALMITRRHHTVPRFAWKASPRIERSAR